MKNSIVTNDYYKVKWEISRGEKMVFPIMFCIFNVIEFLLAFTGRNMYETVLIVIFFDVVIGLLYYIGYRLPCIKWDINWKKQDTEVDITQKQKKYRIIINAVIVCVMLYGMLQTMMIGSIVIKG